MAGAWNVQNFGRDTPADDPGVIPHDPHGSAGLGPSFFAQNGGGGGQNIPPPVGATFTAAFPAYGGGPGPSSAPAWGGTPGSWGHARIPWDDGPPPLVEPQFAGHFGPQSAGHVGDGFKRSGGWTTTYEAPAQHALQFVQPANPYPKSPYPQSPYPTPYPESPYPRTFHQQPQEGYFGRGRSIETHAWPRHEDRGDEWGGNSFFPPERSIHDDDRGHPWWEVPRRRSHSREHEFREFRDPHIPGFGGGSSAPGTPGFSHPQYLPHAFPPFPPAGSPWPMKEQTLTPIKRSKSKSKGRVRSNSFPGVVYNASHLAPRPRHWRAGYISPTESSANPSTPTGLLNFGFGKPKSTVAEVQDPEKRKLNPSLMAPSPSKHLPPNILYDVNVIPSHPGAILLPAFGSIRIHDPMYASAFQQVMASFATDPPAPWMRLFHPSLPWYIDVTPPSPRDMNGRTAYVTIWDIVCAVYGALSQTTSAEEFYNVALHEHDRKIITQAFAIRCEKSPHENLRQLGLKRIDYLGGNQVFSGLKKAKNGMWEAVFSDM